MIRAILIGALAGLIGCGEELNPVSTARATSNGDIVAYHDCGVTSPGGFECVEACWRINDNKPLPQDATIQIDNGTSKPTVGMCFPSCSGC